MALAYKIAPGGVVTAHEIPPSGLYIDCEEVLFDGYEMEGFSDWTLPRITEIVGRVAPFATCWCAPDFGLSNSDGLDYKGFAYWDYDTIVVSSSTHKMSALDIAYHECAHLIENNVTPDFLAKWTACTSRSEWDDEYLDDLFERRVRLLQYYAGYLDHGGNSNTRPGSIGAILHPIYTGEVGRSIVAARAARAAAEARAARPSLWSRLKLAA